MTWPAVLFNLCVGLLFAAYLLRAVRQFERTADRVSAKMDERFAAHTARMDREYAEECARYDAARDNLRAAMRARVDAAVAEVRATNGLAGPARKGVLHHPGTNGTPAPAAAPVPEALGP